MPSRSPNSAARRAVLKHLAAARDSIKTLTGWWDVRATVYINRADRTPGDNTYHRPRHPDEYPEMQPQYWSATATHITHLINELHTLRNYCTEQHAALTATPPPGPVTWTVRGVMPERLWEASTGGHTLTVFYSPTNGHDGYTATYDETPVPGRFRRLDAAKAELIRLAQRPKGS